MMRAAHVLSAPASASAHAGVQDGTLEHLSRVLFSFFGTLFLILLFFLLRRRLRALCSRALLHHPC